MHPKTIARSRHRPAQLSSIPQPSLTFSNGNEKMWKYVYSIIEGKDIKSKYTTWEIRQQVNCTSYNVVYMIICTKDNSNVNIYIGETKRIMKFRVYEHKGYIVNKKLDQITGTHFNLPGHSIDNLLLKILEKCKSNDELYRKERERRHIKLFNLNHEGMNRQEQRRGGLNTTVTLSI